MRFLLLLLSLVLQLNVSGYANHNPQENHAQKTLNSENTFSDERSYNRYRYYDPSSGIYLSQDPIGLDGGRRFYGYVHDPNSWIDAFGLYPHGHHSDPKFMEGEPKQHLTYLTPHRPYSVALVYERIFRN